VSAIADRYAGSIVLGSTVNVRARTLLGGEWSALNQALFEVEELGVPLRITEIMYKPMGGDPYEFIEVQNIGAADLDATGFSLEGVNYFFPPNSILVAGQIIVLASSLSPSSFTARYPGVTVFGYFDGSLADGGQRLALRDGKLQTIVSVDYDDANGWPTASRDAGASLEIIDPAGDPDDPGNWRASASSGG